MQKIDKYPKNALISIYKKGKRGNHNNECNENRDCN